MEQINHKYTICYSRVSTFAQKDDLDRQTEVIHNYAKDNNHNNIKQIVDIGSGINYNKKGITQLINLLLSNKIETLILQHKDRLLRFGSDLILNICKIKGVKVIILENPLNKSKDVADIISILTAYTSRLYA